MGKTSDDAVNIATVHQLDEIENMNPNDTRQWVQTLWNPLDEKRKSPLERTDDEVRVVAYCRVSPTPNKRGRSLQNQMSHYTELIRNKPNWKFVGIYFDDNISGRTIRDRRSFKRVLRHAEEGKLDLIITKSVQRFSRNTKELLEAVEELKGHGVGVYFEKERIDTSIDYNTFLLSTYGSLSQAEVEAMSELGKWGIEQRLLSGRPYFQKTYGYELVKGSGRSELRIINEEAEVVRWIYREYLNGKSQTDIMRALTLSGVKTPRGLDTWNISSVKQILTLPIYTGNYIGRTTNKDLMTNRVRSSEGMRDKILIENANPPIIDLETFEKVQKLIEENRPNKTTASEKTISPFAGRIICGYCGNIHYRTTDRVKAAYWGCKLRVGHKELCPTSYIREEVMRDILQSGFEEWFDFGSDRTVKELEKILERVNKNDHFEFHRLKYLTEIEIAEHLVGSRFTIEDVEDMRKQYREFEEKINQIEDDRKYRDMALDWLSEGKDSVEFLTELTLELMRAWIVSVTIYSYEDYIVHWINGSETQMGDVELSKRKAKDFRKTRDEKIERTKLITGSEAFHANERETKALTTENLISRASYVSDTKYNRIEKTEHLHLDEVIEKYDREEETDVALPQVTQIDHQQHMQLMSRIYKNVKDNNHPKIETKKKLKVAAYVRVSTDKEEQETSLKTQIAFYTYAILKNPEYQFAGIYVDEGITGTSTRHREGFNRMIADCKAGKINLILTKSLSRFSRNTLDAIKYVRILRELESPTYIFFEKENISSEDDTSELMVSLMGALAQQESRNIGSSISWGKRALASRGIVRPRRLNYGYEYNEKKEWVIKEEEAVIVRRIYTDYLNGVRRADIYKSLNDEGIVPPSGSGLWSNSSIKNILDNVVYKGDYIHNQKYKNPDRKQPLVPNRGEIPMIHIEDHHPAIIEKDVWEEVQQMRADRLKSMKRVHLSFEKKEVKNEVFTDKFKCGECGSTVGFGRYMNKKRIQKRDDTTGEIERKRTKEKSSATLFWRCGYGLQNMLQVCDVKQFNQEYLEINFQHLLVEMASNPEFKTYYEREIDELEISEEELSMEKQLIDEMNALYQKLYEAVDEELNKRGRDSQRIDMLTSKIVAIQEHLNIYTEKRERQQHLKSEMEWFFNSYKLQDLLGKKRRMNFYGFDQTRYGKSLLPSNVLETGLKVEEASFNRELFERLIESGVIYKDGTMVFNLKVGLEWSAPVTYKNYKKLITKRRKLENFLKRLDFFNGPKIKKLMKYCQTPRTSHEMLAFMGDVMTIEHFRTTIINPLVEMDRLKRTIPEYIYSHDQKYHAE